MAMQRRDFVKALAGLGGINTLGAAGSLFLPAHAVAAAPDFGDYKALVCIFLYGGNDTFNMLVPAGTDAHKGYDPYAEIRGQLAVTNENLGLNQIASNGGDLNQGRLGDGSGNPYNVNLNQRSAYTRGIYSLSSKGIDLGVNAVMPELAQLIIDDRVSILANSGTLVRPVTRAEIKAGNAELPLYLFAHNHQQRALQTGQADNLGSIGWAGKIADHWINSNQDNPLGLNISYAGMNNMLTGIRTSPLVLKAGQPPDIKHLREGDGNVSEDRRALFKALAGIEGSTTRLEFGANRTASTSDPFKALYNHMLIRSLSSFDQLTQNWNAIETNYSTPGPYGEALFEIPTAQQLGFSSSLDGQLIAQLEAVAKMIHITASGNLGADYNRQIFFVRSGGYDTHANQASHHPLRLRELSLALWKFQKAMEELGHADKVTSFTMSDFGRTLTSNGDGTDHAWGAHQLVMGGYGTGTAGLLDGGKLIGKLPSLQLEGDDSISDKGRFIPSLSQDQVNAALTNWFGVDQEFMPSLFPNLTHFQTTDNIESAYAPLFA
jgi:uncharacterized protein (DUF1501 family)